jgi:hypothetical protein
MRVFKDCKFKKGCLICKKKHTGDAVLIGIEGTQEGFNIEAGLVHMDCFDLRYDKMGNRELIYQVIK